MQNHQTNFFSIKNNLSSSMGILLAFSVIGTLLLGTVSFLEAIISINFALGSIFLIILHKIKWNFSAKFFITILLFLLLWTIPTIVNYHSGTLESEAIKLYRLAYHSLFLTIILSTIYMWQSSMQKYDLRDMQQAFFKFTTIVFVVILIKMFYEFFYIGKPFVFGFTYRHLDAELFLLWLFSVFFISNRFLKIMVIALTFVALILMSVRGGIIASYIFLILVYFPKFIRLLSKYRFYVIITSCIALFFFYQIFYQFLDQILFIESNNRGLGSGITQRTPIWEIAWNLIQERPWFGIGYYVRPNPFSDPNNINLAVHNFLLRIWVENGTPLFLFVFTILGLTVFNIERKNLLWERAAFWSIIFYYFFIPRHIQLNPMSLILYIIIIRSFVLTKYEKNNTYHSASR